MNTMKTRQEMKMNARNILRAHQGQVIGAYLVAMVIAMVVTSVTAGFGSFLVMPVLMVTMKGFFHAMYTGRAMRLEDAGKCLFDNRYLTKTGGYLWMCLLTGLWSCLFVIPGIVMGIAYSMTPYILHDCPNVKAMDAVKISRRMTRGYKVDLFVAELSFLGWELLSLFTFGILEVVFVGPYRELTFGGIYEELKKEALANGTVTREELEGDGAIVMGGYIDTDKL